MSLMMYGIMRGAGAAAPAGGGYTGNELLTLNAALDGTAGYRYWNSSTAYAGAFRIDAEPGGTGDMHDAFAPMAYNPTNDSVFIAGWYTQRTIAEFDIPALVSATAYADISTLNIGAALQTLTSFTGAGTGETVEGMIAGLFVGASNRMLVTTFEHYAQDASYKTIYRVIRDCSTLSTSAVDGYFTTDYDSAAGGWISAVPTAMQTDLDGTHITGFSNSGSRRSSTQSLSMGPAAYTADMTSLMANSSTAASTVLAGAQNVICRYRLDPEGLIPDSELYNWDGVSAILTSNPLWTASADLSYGEIVPGTRTYMVWGSMCMVDSGGWYGNNSGTGANARPPDVAYDPSFDNQGPHPRDPDDWHYHVWLYDVDDLISVQAGTTPASWAARYAAEFGTARALQPHELRPYEWRKFTMPFDTGAGEKFIGGGARKSSSNQVMLSLSRKDSTQGVDAPVIVVFNMGW